eukprot:2134404-Pyramimonas_sp.AAC.1
MAEGESERDTGRGLQRRGLLEVQGMTCPPCAGRGKAKQMIHSNHKNKVTSKTKTSLGARREVRAEDDGGM